MSTESGPEGGLTPGDSEPTVHGERPGWYPDPWGGEGLRYWDGAWTGHVVPRAASESDYPAPAADKVPGPALVWYLRVLALVAPVVGIFVVRAWTDAYEILAIGFVASVGFVARPLWLAALALDAIRSQARIGLDLPAVLMVWYLRVLAFSAPVLFFVVVDAYWGEDTGEDLGAAFMAWGIVGCVTVPLWVAAKHVRAHGAISQRANRIAFGLVLLGLAVFFAVSALVSHYEEDPDPESKMVLWYGLFSAFSLIWSARQFWAATRTKDSHE